MWIVLVVFCLSYCLVAGSFLSSGRSFAMDTAGPSSASSAPLPGTFLGLALDMGSDKLYRTFPVSWDFGPSSPVRLFEGNVCSGQSMYSSCDTG